MLDDFKVSMLSSGSTGNVTYIETSQHKVLVDAGLSGKKINELMKSTGKSLNDIDKIFITHEHVDHLKGVGVLARKYGMDLYANEKTWKIINNKIGEVNVEQKHIFENNSTKLFGDLDVESYAVSHDAVDPQFYIFHHNNKTFAMLTDTGYVNDKMIGVLNNAETILMETNHDVEMLRYGSYNWNLKQRILSDEGHLSNVDGAEALSKIIGRNTQKIYLGHLSQENNQVFLAHLTVEQILQRNNFNVDHDFKLLDTSPEFPTLLSGI